MPIVACITAIAPMRLEPNHKAEMVNQLLFGEFAEVVDEHKDFYKISCIGYTYSGWCQQSQVMQVDAIQQADSFILNAIDEVYFNHLPIRVSIGSSFYQNTSIFKGVSIEYPSNSSTINFSKVTKNEVIIIAEKYLNTPYVWGGRSVFGIDCSGFVQQVFLILGFQLPRDAYEQATLGTDIGFLNQAECGDLAFFDNEKGEIIHVGILVNNHTIIHAAGFVKKDGIDHLG
ncbi:MAG: NlpC/P60 family protein, partial [Chitinophagaceae bacterium]